jgi:bifunctional non-homologous end joining protein LigD
MKWHNARPRERNPRAPQSFIDPCLPTKVDRPPEGGEWAHEIKHDGYRLQIHVGGGGVRLSESWANAFSPALRQKV